MYPTLLRVRSRTRQARPWLVLLLVLSSGSLAVAFDGWEHEDLGNLALRASCRAWESRLNDKTIPPRAGLSDVVTFLKQMDVGYIGDVKKKVRVGSTLEIERVRYGTIVMAVDYMVDNYDLMHGAKTQSGWSASPGDTDFIAIQKLSHSSLDLAAASHINANHFQGRALHAFWFWHREAVRTAYDGNFWAALLLNAYAVHFLQDSFAPGHLVAVRDGNSEDVNALVVHDSVNEAGMNYQFAHSGQILPALRELRAVALTEAEIRSHETRHSRPVFGRVVIRNESLDQLIQQAEQNVGFSFTFYGDKLINRTPEEAPIVLAYTVQSIDDLVEAYLGGVAKAKEPQNSFSTYSWGARYGRGIGRLGSGKLGFGSNVEFLTLNQEFGGLTCHDTSLLAADQRVEIKTGERTEQRSEGGSQSHEEIVPIYAIVPAGGVQDDMKESMLVVASRDLAMGLDVGWQTIVDQPGSPSRRFLDPQVLVFGKRWDYLRRDFPSAGVPLLDQLGVAVGWSFLSNNSSHANGPMVRAIVPVPKINGQLNLIGGFRGYDGSRTRGYGDFEQLRIAWGFGFGSLFLGGGRDHYPGDRSLLSGFAVEAGLSLEYPQSRIREWFSPKNKLKGFEKP